MEKILWLACGITIIVAGLLALRSTTAMYVGRVAVGVLMLLGGALVNAIYLSFNVVDYAGFADPAHFRWVTEAWRAVVAPNQVLFISLLVAFEATVGVLILSGGRRAQLGLLGAIGFHLALWLFGWFETVWCLIVVAPMVLLFVAQRRVSARAPLGRVEARPLTAAGSHR